MLVTDIKRKTTQGKILTGFYMQKYLANNLDQLPAYLDAAWDCVGIISGHGKVRIGKSTMAAQVAYYVAWIIAGGEMDFETEERNVILKYPTRKVRFNLEENYSFSAEDLQEKARHLYKKLGKNQVLVYDEGRQGLDSARTMENVNKGMEDFFQECGYMGHVILIVLPNFFKLHEDYAVARSLFLIDVFAKDGIERGYFNFYNEQQKENLYFFGKKRIGITAKYFAAYPGFWGRFTKWLPFDKEVYEKLKDEALDRKRKTRRERNLLLQRDFLVWILKNNYKIKDDELLEEFERVVDINLSKRTLERSRERINEVIAKKKGY